MNRRSFLWRTASAFTAFFTIRETVAKETDPDDIFSGGGTIIVLPTPQNHDERAMVNLSRAPSPFFVSVSDGARTWDVPSGECREFVIDGQRWKAVGEA